MFYFWHKVKTYSKYLILKTFQKCLSFNSLHHFRSESEWSLSWKKSEAIVCISFFYETLNLMIIQYTNTISGNHLHLNDSQTHGGGVRDVQVLSRGVRSELEETHCDVQEHRRTEQGAEPSSETWAFTHTNINNVMVWFHTHWCCSVCARERETCSS